MKILLQLLQTKTNYQCQLTHNQLGGGITVNWNTALVFVLWDLQNKGSGIVKIIFIKCTNMQIYWPWLCEDKQLFKSWKCTFTQKVVLWKLTGHIYTTLQTKDTLRNRYSGKQPLKSRFVSNKYKLLKQDFLWLFWGKLIYHVLALRVAS